MREVVLNVLGADRLPDKHLPVDASVGVVLVDIVSNVGLGNGQPVLSVSGGGGVAAPRNGG